MTKCDIVVNGEKHQEWLNQVAGIDPGRFVFVDESRGTRSMAYALASA